MGGLLRLLRRFAVVGRLNFRLLMLFQPSFPLNLFRTFRCDPEPVVDDVDDPVDEELAESNLASIPGADSLSMTCWPSALVRVSMRLELKSQIQEVNNSKYYRRASTEFDHYSVGKDPRH